jgi:hypothetical protein
MIQGGQNQGKRSDLTFQHEYTHLESFNEDDIFLDFSIFYGTSVFIESHQGNKMTANDGQWRSPLCF